MKGRVKSWRFSCSINCCLYFSIYTMKGVLLQEDEYEDGNNERNQKQENRSNDRPETQFPVFTVNCVIASPLNRNEWVKMKQMHLQLFWGKRTSHDGWPRKIIERDNRNWREVRGSSSAISFCCSITIHFYSYFAFLTHWMFYCMSCVCLSLIYFSFASLHSKSQHHLLSLFLCLAVKNFLLNNNTKKSFKKKIVEEKEATGVSRNTGALFFLSLSFFSSSRCLRHETLFLMQSQDRKP